MGKFMVVYTFKQGTELSDFQAVIVEEQTKVAQLQVPGKPGANS